MWTKTINKTVTVGTKAYRIRGDTVVVYADTNGDGVSGKATISTVLTAQEQTNLAAILAKFDTAVLPGQGFTES